MFAVKRARIGCGGPSGPKVHAPQGTRVHVLVVFGDTYLLVSEDGGQRWKLPSREVASSKSAHVGTEIILGSCLSIRPSSNRIKPFSIGVSAGVCDIVHLYHLSLAEYRAHRLSKNARWVARSEMLSELRKTSRSVSLLT